MYQINKAISIEGFSAGKNEKFRFPVVLFLPEDQADIVGLTYEHLAAKLSMALLSSNEFCNLVAHLPVYDQRFPVKALLIDEHGQILLKVQVKKDRHLDPDELLRAINFIIAEREEEQKVQEKVKADNAINNLRLAFLLSSSGIQREMKNFKWADEGSCLD